MLQLLEQFFDRAVYFAAIGCERYRRSSLTGAASAVVRTR
jgi:hypothetical protein